MPATKRHAARTALPTPTAAQPGGTGRPAKGADAASPTAADRVSRLAPDPTADKPLYLQLVDNLSAAIAAGQWGPGETLPPERVLCEQLSVSRVTLRMAVDAMVEQGLVTRRQGAGTFVRPSIEHALSSLTSFSEVLRQQGHQPGTQWIEQLLRRAHGEEILRLGLSPDSMVASLTRLRSSDGKVMAYERAVVPARLVPDPKKIGDSLYAYLDARGSPVVRALQHFKAVSLNARLAQYLQMREGEAVLRVVRVGYARDGNAIELTDTFCHNDYYDFVAELRR
ncbi:GntR family transcriptional regulator [Roseateles cellulosilyticus]|uniref:GntR family transcriptional regulator n=1 Tax=Pelomonas cellulosilytica TaxID=2906762 RepID=A0ABS8XMB3_9BURK|nr:GntR family transcriptional regulator [Pelomonas sp. P8]MCE4553922.1 GntR family transcriptional regulator [Pelomonas sp. P8]